MLSLVTVSPVITAFHRLRSWLNHLKKVRGEICPKRSEEETTQKLLRCGQKVCNKQKINSQIKKPHLKMIPIKDRNRTV